MIMWLLATAATVGNAAEPRWVPAPPPPAARVVAPPAPAAPPTAAAAQGCELHVWPSDRFQARNQGYLAGFGVIGTLADAASQTGANAEDRARLGAALDSPGQARALAALDLRRLLALPGYEIVPHEAALAPADAERALRHANSTSPCYAELIVTRVAFRDSDWSGRSLRVGFLFRDFGDAAAPRWRHAGRADNLLGVWPPQHPNEVELAAAELITVFKETVEEYARELREARDEQ
jgi:hypothetical protein